MDFPPNSRIPIPKPRSPDDLEFQRERPHSFTFDLRNLGGTPTGITFVPPSPRVCSVAQRALWAGAYIFFGLSSSGSSPEEYLQPRYSGAGRSIPIARFTISAGWEVWGLEVAHVRAPFPAIDRADLGPSSNSSININAQPFEILFTRNATRGAL